MDSSSHTRPKKPLLVIGSMTNSGSTNPKPYGVSGYSSSSGLERDSRNGNDRNYNNLPLKKSRKMVDSSNDVTVRVHHQFLHAHATSHKWALGVGDLAELLDNSLEEDVVTQSRAVDMGLEKGKHGHVISFSETVSSNEAGELQKVKDESAKLVAKLQRQKEQLESQLKESKCKIQDLEKTHNLKDDSEKLVAELISQLKQSTAKIKDLEKKNDDESAKQVAELQRQKELLEIESEKLKQSEAKTQDLEYKLSNAADEFFQERAHRDSTEHDLRNKLREAYATIHTLTSKINSLEVE